MMPHSRDDKTGSAQRVTIHFSDAGRDALDLVAQRVPTLPYATSGSARFDITVGTIGASITALGEKDQPAWTLARPRGGGAAYWDHANRTCLTWSDRDVHM